MFLLLAFDWCAYIDSQYDDYDDIDYGQQAHAAHVGYGGYGGYGRYHGYGTHHMNAYDVNYNNNDSTLLLVGVSGIITVLIGLCCMVICCGLVIFGMIIMKQYQQLAVKRVVDQYGHVNNDDDV